MTLTKILKLKNYMFTLKWSRVYNDIVLIFDWQYHIGPSQYRQQSFKYAYSSGPEKRKSLRLAEEVGERQAEEKSNVGQHKDPIPQSWKTT
jgi:hypothetical protein